MKESSYISNNSPEVKMKIAASKLIEDNFQRKDCYGNIISKKLKKHKICFPDVLDSHKDIAEIYIVTSYKQTHDSRIYCLT